MNLLVITQKVDADDEAIGFFLLWLERLAARVQTLYVIAGGVGRHTLPANVRVYSMGREKQHGPLRRYLNFYRFFLPLLPRITGVFAHMSPTYPIMAWPARLIGKPIVLWYAHAFSNPLRLKIATLLSKRVMSISTETFPFPTQKLLATGHGINAEIFQCQRQSFENRQLRIVSINRISRVKKLELLIQAMRILRDEFHVADAVLTLVGSPYLPTDEVYMQELRNLVRQYGLARQVIFEKGISNAQVPAWYCRADVVAAGQSLGGLNKSTLEGMACGCIPIIPEQVVNPFGADAAMCIYRPDDSRDCAKLLAGIAQASAEERRRLSEYARRIVNERHNLNRLADTIVSIF